MGGFRSTGGRESAASALMGCGWGDPQATRPEEVRAVGSQLHLQPQAMALFTWVSLVNGTTVMTVTPARRAPMRVQGAVA